MTHMQMIAFGLWQAVAPVAVAALCLMLFAWVRNRRNDDDDHFDGPALLVDPIPFPFGFHSPRASED